MDKLKFKTPDAVSGNVEKIGALFPSAVTEMRGPDGKVQKGINFEVLKQLLSRDVVDGDECYEFTWVGKKAAIAEAARPITKTLRPVPDEQNSRNWDTTENLYIEGDNLEALKILQESYLGKVKMIYIDPPYNTGHDFVYPDSFTMDDEEYSAGTGYFDEDGNINYARENTANAGKYHSDWCSMMYSRLALARNLLSEDGTLCISIDDNEVENAKKVGCEVFGESGFIGQIVVVSNLKGRNDGKNFALCHEYLLFFAKTEFSTKGLPLTDEQRAAYNLVDVDGNAYQLRDLRKRGNGDKRADRPNMFYPIYYNKETNKISLEQFEESIEILPKLSSGEDGRWRWGKSRVEANLHLLEPHYIKQKDKWGVNYRVYLNPKLNPMDDDNEDEKTSKVKTVWSSPELSSDVARRSLKNYSIIHHLISLSQLIY